MKILDHKCLACGAMLPFNPATQMWDCEYCGISYKLNDLKNFDEVLVNEQKQYELDCYRCPDCGAEVIADETTTATFCVYCGNANIIKGRLEGKYNPSKIIPFKITKEQAINSFKKVKKWRIYTPKEFNKEENIEKITGVYIPFWIYDCEVHGEAIYDAQYRTMGKGLLKEYVEIDHYEIERAGSMNFSKIPVDGSSKFNDAMMDSIEPFDYSAAEEFDMSYLSGFLAEKYNVKKENAAVRMCERVKRTTLDELDKTIKLYDEIKIRKSNVQVYIKSMEYVLLPVWLLNIKFKNKVYLFATNGQTGKIVGDIPVDEKKIKRVSIITFILFFILWHFIIYYSL